MKKCRDMGRDDLIASKRTGTMMNITSSDSWLERDKRRKRGKWDGGGGRERGES
jgi:hypothetical protein